MIAVEFFADDEASDEFDRDPFGEGPLLPPLDPKRCIFPVQHPLHSRSIIAICRILSIANSRSFFEDLEIAASKAALGLLQRSTNRDWKAEADVLAVGVADPIELLKRDRRGELSAECGSLARMAISLSSQRHDATTVDSSDSIDRIIRYTDELRSFFRSLLQVANENASRRGPRKMDHMDELIDWCCVALGPDKSLPSNQDIDDVSRKTRLLQLCEFCVRAASLKSRRCIGTGSDLWRADELEIDKIINFYIDWSARVLVSRIRERLQILGAMVSA